MTISRKLALRLTNNIRMLDHIACLAAGLLTQLIIDTAKTARKLDLDGNPIAANLNAIDGTIEMLREQVDQLHEAMANIANDAGIDIPQDGEPGVVNSGPGK